MSTKQLARTVLDGRKVHMHFPDRSVLSGYLCGMDDFHWMVITPSGDTVLVHKAGPAYVTLDTAQTYSDEPNHSDLEKVVRPFRAFVETEYFGRTKASSSPAKEQELVS